jgi:hypothetical protein
MLSVILNVVILGVVNIRFYDRYHNSEYSMLVVEILSTIMLSIVMLSNDMLSIFILSEVMPIVNTQYCNSPCCILSVTILQCHYAECYSEGSYTRCS